MTAKHAVRHGVNDVALAVGIACGAGAVQERCDRGVAAEHDCGGEQDEKQRGGNNEPERMRAILIAAGPQMDVPARIRGGAVRFDIPVERPRACVFARAHIGMKR